MLRAEPKPEEYSELNQLSGDDAAAEEQQSPLSPGARKKQLVSKAITKKNAIGSNEQDK